MFCFYLWLDFNIEFLFMKTRILVAFLALSSLISGLSCSNKPKTSRKPVAQIEIVNAGKKLVYGSDIVIKITVKLKDGNLENSELYIDNKLVASSNQLEFTHTLQKYDEVGNHTVKVISKKTDGTEGNNFKDFEIVSDIIPEKYSIEVVKAHPHNTTFFTEGLEIKDGFLYESTGENGKSALYKLNLTTGKVLQSYKLENKYFGEGITILNDKIYQLTYKTQKGFIYDLKNMAVIDSFKFESTEGWGMTNDGKNLIMSDGTNTLTYLDPQSLKPVRKLQVSDNKGIVNSINELEYSDGYIYANVWTQNYLIKIDTSSGKVVQQIDLSKVFDLLPGPKDKIDVLNGIAIDPVTKKMYVTGKYYSSLFEIKPIKTE